MKKSKLKVIALAAMLGAAGVSIIGCTDNSSSSSESSSSSSSSVDQHPDEEKESSSSDSRAFNIWLDSELSAQNGNLEIANGGRYLLWKHISVPKGTYVLEAKSDNITIDGHVIEATATGSFKVQITATSTDGGSKKTKIISGVVVTDEKVAFNEFWKNMSSTNNYRATGDIFGETVHFGDKAYEYLYGTNSQTRKSVYNGSVYDKTTDHWYSYQYEEGAKELTFEGGYGLSATSFGLEAGLNSIESYQWKELTDKSGNGTGEFYLEDTIETSNGYSYSNLIDPLYDTIFGTLNNVWSNVCMSRLKATGLVATLEDDLLTLTPVDASMNKLKTYKTTSSSYSLLSIISEVGTAANELVDSWIAKPTYPESVDITGLKSAFANIEDKKNYTMQTVAMWLDTSSGEATDTPESLAEYFEPFISTVMVDGDLKVDGVNYSTSTQWNFLAASGLDEMFMGEGAEYELPSAGDVTASFIKDGKYCQAEGTIGEDGTITYGQTQTGSELVSLWGNSASKSLGIVTEGLGDVLDTVSFSSSRDVDGATAYYFNTCGDDYNSEYEIASWSNGAIVGGISPWIYAENSDFLALNMEAVMSYGFGRVGAELYFNRFFLVEGDDIELYEVLTYDRTTAFVMETTWTKIGTTTLDAASKALLG